MKGFTGDQTVCAPAAGERPDMEQAEPAAAWQADGHSCVEQELKRAGRLYGSGCTCSQAVFCAFAQELGLEEETAYRMMEGFGGGFGALQEVCGAFAAAVAIISWHTSSGSGDGASKPETYCAVQRAAEIFRQEYGSIRCKEILHGQAPKAFQCGMKVKDAVLLVRKVLAERSAAARL